MPLTAAPFATVTPIARPALAQMSELAAELLAFELCRRLEALESRA